MGKVRPERFCVTCGASLAGTGARTYCSPNCAWLATPGGRKFRARAAPQVQERIARQASHQRRHHILVALRRRIVERERGLCRYCGDVGTTLDHIFPWSLGGPDTEENLVLACPRCNFVAQARCFAGPEEKAAWLRERRRGEPRADRCEFLTVCIDCFRAFRPGVDWATNFLCPECAMVA